MKKTILSAVLVLAAVSVSAKDIRTLVVTTSPKMHCESCENNIKSHLRFEKGIKKIVTNIPDQTVTITYDADKNRPEDIIEAFGKFGYEATDADKKCCGKQEGEGCSKKETSPEGCCGKSDRK